MRKSSVEGGDLEKASLKERPWFQETETSVRGADTSVEASRKAGERWRVASSKRGPSIGICDAEGPRPTSNVTCKTLAAPRGACRT